jgi:hypothetical protein
VNGSSAVILVLSPAFFHCEAISIAGSHLTFVLGLLASTLLLSRPCRQSRAVGAFALLAGLLTAIAFQVALSLVIELIGLLRTLPVRTMIAPQPSFAILAQKHLPRDYYAADPRCATFVGRFNQMVENSLLETD